jgi:hypothetical protein
MADTPRISVPVKAGFTGVVAGGLATIGYVFRRDPQVTFILLLGVLAVALLLLVYRWWLGRRDRAEAAKISTDITAARKPREISRPEQLAKLADLQSKFEAGVAKFRAAGKNLYSLPWYMVVGESGGGKSEAIRHCNVGFPPGLQEEQQGVGGTVNMNWWFTNYAVILDTAGKMMFGEVEAGASAEWPEFLRLLVKTRPNCPINGLLLVIPADSLIVDDADKLDRKAGKIAEQLGVIQRALGVRFPAFVVVTKSDQILGFREFFDALADPRAQHQMLGWSNPDPLDAPFNPELVEQHLATVQEQLNRRRLGLLLDPVHTENVRGRRLDEVDALYAFPEALTVLGPRLRRYMERIFTAGEWSPKPLFLRGIYFTSSMREGSALDDGLARFLGVPPQSLPEGRVWERDRSFFLRDLFTTKVFREKGLVTRLGKTRGVQARRKAAVLGAGFLAVAVLAGLTVYGRWQLDLNVDAQAKYWADLHRAYTAPAPEGTSGNLSLLAMAAGPTFTYRGPTAVTWGDECQPLRDLWAGAKARAVDTVHVPWAFSWARASASATPQERLTGAFRHVFETTVLQPLVDGVRKKLSADPLPDSEAAGRAAHALAALLQLEGSPGHAPGPAFTLEPLFRYLLDQPKELDAYTRDAATLQSTYAWLYPDARRSFDTLQTGTADTAVPARQGLDRLADYWAAQFGDEANSQRITARLRATLLAMKSADDGLRKLAADVERKPIVDSIGLSGWQPEWTKQREAFDARCKGADDLLPQIEAQRKRLHGATALADLYAIDRAAAAEAVRQQLAVVSDACGQVPKGAGPAYELAQGFLAGKLKSTQERLDQTAPTDTGALGEELRSLDDSYYHAGVGADPRYRQIRRAYGVADASLDALTKQASSGTPAAAIASLATSAAAARAQAKADVDKADADLPAADNKPQREACDSVLNHAMLSFRLNGLVSDALKVNFASADDVAKLVRDQAAPAASLDPPPPPLSATPAGEATDPQSYQRDAAIQLLTAWAVVATEVGHCPDLADEFHGEDDAVKAYAAAYVKHWDAVLSAVGQPVASPTWNLVKAQLPTEDAAATAVAATAAAVDGAVRPIAATPEARALLQRAARGVTSADRAAMTPVRSRWADLTARTTAEARAELVGEGLPAVARNDLAIGNDPPIAAGESPYVDYWRNVARTAITALSNEPGGFVGDQLAQLNAFPFAPPAKGVPPADLDAAGQALDRLDAATRAAVGPADPAVPWLAGVYQRIVGGGTGTTDPGAAARDAKLARDRAVLDLIRTAQTVPPCKLSTVLDATQARLRGPGRAAPAGTTVAFWLRVPNEVHGTKLSDDLDAVPTGASQTRVFYPPAATKDDALVIQLNGNGGTTCRFEGPYPYLRALYSTAAGLKPKPLQDPRQWLVPVADAAGNVVYVQFTFAKPIKELP